MKMQDWNMQEAPETKLSEIKLGHLPSAVGLECGWGGNSPAVIQLAGRGLPSHLNYQ